jgi:hypothetical protein
VDILQYIRNLVNRRDLPRSARITSILAADVLRPSAVRLNERSLSEQSSGSIEFCGWRDINASGVSAYLCRVPLARDDKHKQGGFRKIVEHIFHVSLRAFLYFAMIHHVPELAIDVRAKAGEDMSS